MGGCGARSEGVWIDVEVSVEDGACSICALQGVCFCLGECAHVSHTCTQHTLCGSPLDRILSQYVFWVTRYTISPPGTEQLRM